MLGRNIDSNFSVRLTGAGGLILVNRNLIGSAGFEYQRTAVILGVNVSVVSICHTGIGNRVIVADGVIHRTADLKAALSAGSPVK